MGEIVSLKTEHDGLQVEFELVSPISVSKNCDERQLEILEKLDSLEKLMEENQRLIDEYDAEINRLTNQADGLDYTVAVACGVLTGAMDAFFVGEFDFEDSWDKVNNKFQDIVSKKATKIEEAERDQKIQKAIENAQKKAQEKGGSLSEDKAKEIADNIKKKFDEDHDVEGKIKKAIEKAKEQGEKVDESEIREKVLNSEMSKKIKKLEETFGMPSDSVYQEYNEKVNQEIKKKIEKAVKDGASDSDIKALKDKLEEELKSHISDKSHHLDDLSHHPSIIGWASSIITQFTGNTYFQNKDGKNYKFKGNKVRVINNINAYIQYGGTEIIEKSTKNGGIKQVLEVTLVGDDLKSKLACGTFNWLGHLISDLAGSNGSAKKGNAGMGLPGPLMSTLKEFAMLPLIRKTKLPELLNDLFTKDDALFGKYRVDLRSELALGMEIGKQAIPVFINELLVRSFYFIRRLISEIKAVDSFKQINWDATKPWKNRTIVRMLTISMGTFEVIDLGDAAIRGAIKSGGTLPGFFAQFVLRVNFVGVGRFAIACGTDVAMGAKKEKVRNQRIETYTQQIFYNDAKVYYKQANMWIAAENAGETIEDAYSMIASSSKAFAESMQDIKERMLCISEYIPAIEEKNPGLLSDLDDILNWG